MKQRPVLTAVFGAALLLLTACSQSVPGAAQAGGTVSSSSSASTSTSSSDESTTETTKTTKTTETTDTTDTSSSSGLDSDTEYWFTTFCQGITDLTQFASPDTSGQTLAQAQETVAEAYSNISVSAETTVEILQLTPPPAVTNGEDLAKAAIDRLSSLSSVYGKGAQTITALTPSSKADLENAIDAIEKEASDAQPGTMADVDAAVLAAAKELPECQKVLN
ncbi:MAG TPA: hypothetical protein VES60_06830 [Nakamurella sp.]|nr:hypothetical protein [Nakamurella sp.]